MNYGNRFHKKVQKNINRENNITKSLSCGGVNLFPVTKLVSVTFLCFFFLLYCKSQNRIRKEYEFDLVLDFHIFESTVFESRDGFLPPSRQKTYRDKPLNYLAKKLQISKRF